MMIITKIKLQIKEEEEPAKYHKKKKLRKK